MTGVARRLVLKERLNALGNALKALPSSHQWQRLDSTRLINRCYLQIFTTLDELVLLTAFSSLQNEFTSSVTTSKPENDDLNLYRLYDWFSYVTHSRPRLRGFKRC